MSNDIFKNTMNFLREIQETQKFTVQIETDKEGYYDKECPSIECLSKFKVFAEDWVNTIIPNDKCHCPFCGHVAGYNSWWTTEQIEEGRKQAIESVSAGLGKALEQDTIAFNKRQSKNSFLKMSMKFSGSKSAVALPIEALEAMQQKNVCEHCGVRYAVVGSAFFCPACGYNSAKKTFNNAIDKVNAKICNLNKIKVAISVYSRDDAEYTCQSLIESSVSDLVVALQRLCECIYPTLENAQPLKKNVFQRLGDSNNLWKDICGKDYTDWLTKEEYSILLRCFQQRHILQHKDGIIDSEYISKSGDNRYTVGQRIVIKESDVTAYATIIKKLGDIIINI